MLLVSVPTMASTLYVGGLSDLQALYLTTLNMTATPPNTKDPSWSITVSPCQWKGVGCDANGNVTQIAWYSLELGGFPNLATLPPGLLLMSLNQNGFIGVPDLTALPPGMQELYLGSNQYTGTPNFTMLPAGLQGLYLPYNLLSGTPNLASLPAGLLEFDLKGNFFESHLVNWYGTFVPNAQWCFNEPVQASMCAAGYDATFNCSEGRWTC